MDLYITSYFIISLNIELFVKFISVKRVFHLRELYESKGKK